MEGVALPGDTVASLEGRDGTVRLGEGLAAVRGRRERRVMRSMTNIGEATVRYCHPLKTALHAT